LANKGLIAASAAGAVVVIGAIVYFLAPGILGGSIPPPVNGGDDNNNTTTVASPGEAPKMLLVLLEGPEDASTAVAQYEANNTKPIQLAGNAHIRFDSPDYRTAESIRVIARDLDTGEIQLLRKSYDVNNEFFINVGEGHYELQVQATWFEKGSFVYRFETMIA
jgi:hypothetical protein